MDKYQDAPDKIIMDRHYFMVIMDKLEEVVKRIAKIELNIESLTDIYEEKLDRLRNELQSGKIEFKFIKETKQALDDEAKEYYEKTVSD